MFKIKDLENIPVLKSIIFKHKKRVKTFSIDLVVRQVVREIINEMVKDIIFTTQNNIKKKNIKNLNDVYKSKYPIVSFSKKMKKFDITIKNF